MEAFKEINRLREKMLSGDLDPEEPIFTLRGRDALAPGVVEFWCALATGFGTPAHKLAEARALAEKMRSWPIKQYPGRDDTRTDRRIDGEARGPRDPFPPQG